MNHKIEESMESSGLIVLVNDETIECYSIGPKNHADIPPALPSLHDTITCKNREGAYLVYRWNDIREIRLNRLPYKHPIHPLN